jgi:hypothetical protein
LQLTGAEEGSLHRLSNDGNGLLSVVIFGANRYISLSAFVKRKISVLIFNQGTEALSLLPTKH